MDQADSTSKCNVHIHPSFDRAFNGAIRDLRKITGQINKALSTLRSVLEKMPTSADREMLVTECCRLTYRLDEAQASLHQIELTRATTAGAAIVLLQDGW